MPSWTFRIADVFDPDAPLDVWMCTLPVAFNDLVHANLKEQQAQHDWERLYEWRVATGHFTEACLHLERARGIDEVQQFLDAENGLRALYEDVLGRYDSQQKLVNQIRNEAAFHYAYKKGQKAVARALRELGDDQGLIGGTGTKIKDSRQVFADDVIAKLVVNATGGTLETYADAMEVLGDAVAALGGFSNAALDAFFVRHREALTQGD